MTTATMVAASTVTPNMTPEELVKFMDVAVASKYGNDLSNLTCVIIDDVRSTLESFKTDLHNALSRQIRSVVQQVQGEAQGKQPIGSPSTPYLGNTSALGNIGTPYPGNTSAPGNMGTLFPDSTTALGNTGGLANNSTPHPGSTSGNVIYVDASLPYSRSTSMGNPGVFPTARIPYPGGAHPLHITQGYLHTLPNQTRV
jgi:hypothetical protein